MPALCAQNSCHSVCRYPWQCRGQAAISPACCNTRRASPANGWRCSRKLHRILRALPLSPIQECLVFDYFLQSAKAVAPSLAIDLVPTPVDNAADIERAIKAFAREPNGGMVLPADTSTVVHRNLIISLAARHRLPAVYALRVLVAAGGLMSYGPDFVDLYRQSASYVDRILRGTKPADLPVQTPTKFETVVNRKTAKALGLTVPPGLLIAADEVIE